MTDEARTEVARLAWELVRESIKDLDQAIQGLDPAIDLRPARDRVLVALIPEEYVTGSGLILNVGEKVSWRGMVLATGPKVEELERNDIVVVDHVTGQPIPWPGTDDAGVELRLIQLADILAVFTPAEGAAQ